MKIKNNEQTLIIIKPDGVGVGLTDEIFERFKKMGLKDSSLDIIRLQKPFVRKFYSHLKNKLEKDHFESVVNFMTCRASIVAVMEGKNAIKKARELCGPTDPAKAKKGTIRGDFSNDNLEECSIEGRALRNIIHSSENSEEAIKEIKMMRNITNI